MPDRFGTDGELIEELEPNKTKRKIGFQSRGKKLKKAALNLFKMALLVAVLTAIFAGCGLLFWKSQEPVRNTEAFAQSFIQSEAGQAGTFSLGESGSPVFYPLAVGLPQGWTSVRSATRNGWEVETLAGLPRIYSISDCDFFALNAGATQVYALTIFEDPNKIFIDVPLENTGMVNVCTVLGHIVEVVLWSN